MMSSSSPSPSPTHRGSSSRSPSGVGRQGRAGLSPSRDTTAEDVEGQEPNAPIAAGIASSSASASSSSSSSARSASVPRKRCRCSGSSLLVSAVGLIVSTFILAMVAAWVLNAARAAPKGIEMIKHTSTHTDTPSTTIGAPTDHPKTDQLPVGTGADDASGKHDFVLFGPEKRPADNEYAYNPSHPLDPHSHAHVHQSYQAARGINRQMAQLQLATTTAGEENGGEISDYLFLRSTPRLRERHTSAQTANESEAEPRVHIGITGPAIPVGDPFGSFAAVNFARGEAAQRTTTARHAISLTPFLVHVKSPATVHSRALVEAAVGGASGFYVERYLPVANYLVVPKDESANQTAMFQALERLKPMVQAWHAYEKQDKIDPFLYDSCNDTHELIRQFMSDSDAPTFDLHVSLFHAATTEAHASAGAKTDHAHGHASTLHAVIPPRTRHIVEHWQQVLESRGSPWKEVAVRAESAQLVEVNIPLAFFDQHVGEALVKPKHPHASFCHLLDLFAANIHTEFIEQCAAFETHNRYASPLIQTGTYRRPGTIHAHGLTGRGQVVTVADTGVAHANCFFKDAHVAAPIDTVDFAHRKIVSYMRTRGKSYDLAAGHGTHTAASIAGSILPADIASASTDEHAATLRRLSEYGGVAPDAKLAVFDVNDGLSAGKIKPPKDIYRGYYQLAFETMGARISSNSWGARNGSYIVECRETDRFVFDHPDFLPIYSSGNYGERGYQSVVAPGTSKNCLTIGAVGNVKIKPGVQGSFFCSPKAQGEPSTSPGYTGGWSSAQGDTPPADDDSSGQSRFLDESIYLRRLYSFISGAGPTYDQRYKPEALAPGHYIISAEGAAELDSCKDCDRSLMSLFGTSMSAAIAAGSAALIRQYFLDGFYPRGVATPSDGFTPSAALMKAILLASAVPDTVEATLMEGQFEELDPSAAVPIPDQTGPTPKSGFGRIQLDRALKLKDSNVDLWLADRKSIGAGDFHAYCFQITAPRAPASPDDGPAPLLPFRATLVWSDPPSALSSTWLLLNNLDLSVSNVATGAVFVGNQHAGDSAPMYDSTNNVEQVSLAPTTNTQPGDLFSVHVRGTAISEGASQDYALAVSGHFEALPAQACAGGVVCPRHCSNRGVCSDAGACKCQAGFAGIDCAQTSVALPVCSSPVVSSVSFGKFAYFHFDVPPMASGAAPPSYRIRMRSLVGEPDVYVAHARLPSLQQFDFSHLLAVVNRPPTADADVDQASGHLTTEVDIPIARSGRYYIGVYGYCCESTSHFEIEATQCRRDETTAMGYDQRTCECERGA